jgi:hypothetical protein
MSARVLGPVTEGDIFEAAHSTRGVELYLESNHESAGASKLGNLIVDHIGKNAVAGVSRWEGTPLDDRAIDMQVSLRSGEREINDRTAVAIATALAGSQTRLYPAIRKLSQQGFADKEALNTEFGALYELQETPRTRDRVNAMFTWAIHGGDNN